MVLCGDFNWVPDPTVDSTSHSKWSTASLQGPLHSADLYNVWRCFHSNERDFAFFSSPHLSYMRIDLFLVDHQTLCKVVSSSINNITWSDHASINLTVTLQNLTFLECNSAGVWLALVMVLLNSLVKNNCNLWSSDCRVYQNPFRIFSKKKNLQCRKGKK